MDEKREMERLNKVSNANRPEGYHNVEHKNNWTCAYDGTRKKLKDGRCAACGRSSAEEAKRDAKEWDERAEKNAGIDNPNNYAPCNCGKNHGFHVIQENCSPHHNHTQTPWKIEESYVGARYMVRSAHSDETAMTRYREDAAFIVRAVNSHEELINAMKEISIHIRGKCDHETQDECDDCIGLIVADAIAKAEGK